MKKLEKAKYIAMGMVITTGLFSSIPVIASSFAKNIDVVYDDIKLIVDGESVALKNEPFMYNDTTYLPVRAVGDALGKEVSYDSSTKTIYIGKQQMDSKKFLGKDILPYQSSSKYYYYTSADKAIIMGGKEYTNAFALGSTIEEVYTSYNIEGKYTKLTGLVGHVDGDDYGARVSIYGDEKLLKQFNYKDNEAPIPEEFNIDITGINKLKITVSRNGLYPTSNYGFANVGLE